MNFSLFGKKFTRHAGITQLMDDLNEGLRTPGAIMLGGGNPAHIPEMDSYFQQLCQDMLAQGKLTEALCNYDGPPTDGFFSDVARLSGGRAQPGADGGMDALRDSVAEQKDESMPFRALLND